MRELVSYTCSACGGALTVDRNQEVYECPFCGNGYDFVQMHHDELLKNAAVNMRQMEFTAAKEKYDSILESEPQDFEALRGLALCSGGIISTDSMRKPEKMAICSFDLMKRTLQDVQKRAKETDLPYFERMYELADLAQQHAEATEERARLGSDSNRRFDEIMEVDEERRSSNEKAWDVAKTIGMIIALPFSGKYGSWDKERSGVPGLIIGAIALIVALFFFFGYWAFLILAGIIAVIVGIVLLVRKSDNDIKNEKRTRMRSNNSKDNSASIKLAEIEKKYSEVYLSLRKFEQKCSKPEAVTYTPVKD